MTVALKPMAKVAIAIVAITPTRSLALTLDAGRSLNPPL